jgi:serine/threonine protein kinase
VRPGTFVGTALYVAPEMLEFNSSGFYTDLWALGCIIYEMLVGYSPFYAKSKDIVFSNVLERKFTFPPDLDKDAKDLIDKLLEIVPGNRIGLKNGSFDEINCYQEIKSHPFFSDIDFNALSERKLPVPFNTVSSTMTDSDENSTSKKEESLMKKSGPIYDDINKYFDECCIYRVRFLTRKYWEGEVKVRRKFFLIRSRYLILFEDGTLMVLRKGHIKMEYVIDDDADIILNKNNRFTLKNPGKSAESFETPDAEAWVSILKSI